MRTLARLTLLALLIAASAAASMPASGASSGVNVTFNVLSSTTLDTSACQTATPATQFGSIPAGTFATTGADCRVTFGSQNDVGSLYAYQADGAGSAMSGAVANTLDTDGFAAPTGKYVVSTGTLEDMFQAVDTQPDGKILVAGWRNQGGTEEAVLRRLNPDGTLDTTFSSGDGTNGYATFDPGAGTESKWYGVRVQSDGKIVVAGQADFGGTTAGMVARYTSTGVLDTGNFNGASGYRVFKYNGANWTWIRDMALAPDGSIFVGGWASSSGERAYVTKIGSDGNFAPGWTQNGYLYPGGFESHLNSMVVRPDGRILVGGWVSSGASQDTRNLLVLQLTSTAAIDTSFATAGALTLDLGALAEEVLDMVVMPDGRVAFVGADCQSSNCVGGGIPYRTLVGRITEAGTWDTTFNSPTGYRTDAPVAGGNVANAITLDHDGSKIYTAGHGWQTNEELFVGRYNANGTNDATWGAGGFQVRDLGGLIQGANAATLDPQGRLLVVGNEGTGADYDSVIWAFDNAGVPDYLDGTNDFDQGSGFFGACLRTPTGGNFTATWSADASCTQTDAAGGWHGFPAWHDRTSIKIGTAAYGQTNVAVDLRFGAKVPLTQQTGSYTAPIVFEVRAP